MTAPMSSNIANPGNFLRTSRSFPSDIQSLAAELSKTYIDIANQVNNRTSGIFGSAPTITGESWFLGGEVSRQQTLRQVYPITGAGNYAHKIDVPNISGFTKIYGTFVDNARIWYPIPYVDVVSVTNQVGVSVTPLNIVLVSGSTAPVIVSGFVILEWLSLG
jgi:hypothetical protein